MSATIRYRRVDKEDPYLHKALAPSSLMELLELGFGEFPVILGESSIPKLEGMAVAAKGQREAIEEIIEIIRKYGPIQLYATR